MSKIDQNDPRLTAYALDEMPVTERAEFEKLLSDDPAARATVDEIRRTATLLSGALAAEPLPERSVMITHAHARPHWLRRLVTESWTIWVPLGATAAFALFFWRVYLPEYRRQQDLARNNTGPAAASPSGIPIEIADTGSPDGAAQTGTATPSVPIPAAPTGLESAATTLKTGYFLTARQTPSSCFAVNVDTAAYADVRRSLEAGERPPTGLVRIEELVNSFHYNYPKPTGDAALALSTEMHPAPWSDGHLLVRIGLQGREASTELATARSQDAAREHLTASAAVEIRAIAARDVKVQVDFNPERVLAYRLIGYENRLLKGEAAESTANNDLAAGRSVTALYEIIPLPPARPHTTVAAAPALPTPGPSDTAAWLTVKLRYTEPGAAKNRSVIVPLHANVAAEPAAATPDFKFAAAVAGFGLILQDNPNKGTATWDMVEELAKAGIATGDTASASQRRGFVSLVRKARAIEARVDAPAEESKPEAGAQN
jgi:hypothetical protein